MTPRYRTCPSCNRSLVESSYGTFVNNDGRAQYYRQCIDCRARRNSASHTKPKQSTPRLVLGTITTTELSQDEADLQCRAAVRAVFRAVRERRVA